MRNASGIAGKTRITTLLLLAPLALVGCSPEQPAQRGKIQDQDAGAPANGSPGAGWTYEAIDEELWADKVHVGRWVDANGRITPNARADEFSLDDRVYVSMEVSEAPTGSPVLVLVVNATTNRELWSESRPIVAGVSHLVFEVDSSRLGSGAYRAEVYVGDERVSRHDFDIHA